VRRKDEESIIDKELGEILLYLARIYKKIGNHDKTTWAAKRLYDFNGPERDEAH
jgi:anaphase-promoting complex subunit 8